MTQENTTNTEQKEDEIRGFKRKPSKSQIIKCVIWSEIGRAHV